MPTRPFLALGLAMTASVASAADPKVDFNRDVRPILAAKCFACHGPDDSRRKAGLRLDLRDPATRAVKSGAVAIVPGKPEESELVERIDAEEAERIMPPPGSHKTLSSRDRDILKRWIAEGAEYREHWAFLKPVRPDLPSVKARGWVRNPIDCFVLARLEGEGLSPSPEAGRAALLRRVSLDLIGLPPTIAELDAFLNDSSPDAYEKVVDRLLASPHYGERWARRWLDRARYADTNGYEKDRERSIWPYRDWIIRALNDDMPFDRFTVEQIAGDLLPDATIDQKVATGFHRNTMTNEEGGIDIEEFRFASVVDRVATTGTVWLGLTIGCAQCHTHKFDPITQPEYYGLLAFLDNADEPELDLPRADIAAKRAEITAKVAARRADLASLFPADDESAGWEVLQPISATTESAAALAKQDDGSLLASGPAPEADSYTLVFETGLQEITSIRLDALTDPSLPHGGPGRAPNGNFVLRELRVQASPRSDPSKAIPVAFGGATAEFSQREFDVKGAVDGDLSTGWAIDDGSGRLNRDRSATFLLKEKVGFEGGTRLAITLENRYGGKHTLGRFRLSAKGPASDSARPVEERRREHLAAKQAAWEQSLRPTRWVPLSPSRVVSKKHATMNVLEDNSVLATGDKPNNDTYEVDIPSNLKGITALRLEVLPDPSLPDQGPGRAP